MAEDNVFLRNDNISKMFDLLMSLDSCLVSFGIFLEENYPGALFKYGFEDDFIDRVKSIMREALKLENKVKIVEDQ